MALGDRGSPEDDTGHMGHMPGVTSTFYSGIQGVKKLCDLEHERLAQCTGRAYERARAALFHENKINDDTRSSVSSNSSVYAYITNALSQPNKILSTRRLEIQYYLGLLLRRWPRPRRGKH